MSMHSQDTSLAITVIDEKLIVKSICDEKLAESKSQGNGPNPGNPHGSSYGYSSPMKGIMGFGRDKNKKWDRSSDAQVQEPVLLEEVGSLRLSYKNILKIDNLVGLSSLHTLCLDNNTIEQITGIGHLVNLKWLDLSFNNITEIKGLENLTKLQDLSLFNNNISKVCNLNACVDTLEVLSIGNNAISKLDNLLYLRQFKSLRLANFEGNPVCSDPEYRMFVLAYLSSLKYLDYALIEENEFTSAKEQYQDELQEIGEREALEEAHKQSTANQEKYFEKLKRTNLYIVETLFTEMFKADNEFQKYKILPGFETIMDSYQHEFHHQVETMITAGLELFEQAEEETGKFQTAVDKVTKTNESRSRNLIETFNREKKLLFRKYNEGDMERNDMQTRFDKLENQRVQLGDSLLSIEMKQVEQLATLRDVFENRSSTIKAARLDRAQVFFRAVEDLENSWFTNAEKLVQSLMDKLNNNETIEDANEDILNLLGDRETLLGAIQSSHDIHLGKLLAQEDNMRESLIKGYNNLMNNTKADHLQANRDRVSEIQRLLQNADREISVIVSDEQGDEDD